MTEPEIAFFAGLGLSALNLYGWRLGLNTATRTFAGHKATKLGTAFVLLVFFVKLPLLMVAGIWFMRRPAPVPTCFLVGFGLVYSALIGWALATGQRPTVSA